MIQMRAGSAPALTVLRPIRPRRRSYPSCWLRAYLMNHTLIEHGASTVHYLVCLLAILRYLPGSILGFKQRLAGPMAMSVNEMTRWYRPS